jgi:hypothetical protein
MRHGLDADHLATIGRLTRGNTRRDPALRARAGWCSRSATARSCWLSQWLPRSSRGRWQTPQWLSVSGRP